MPQQHLMMRDPQLERQASLFAVFVSCGPDQDRAAISFLVSSL